MCVIEHIYTWFSTGNSAQALELDAGEVAVLREQEMKVLQEKLAKVSRT